jgi:TonB family protein
MRHRTRTLDLLFAGLALCLWAGAVCAQPPASEVTSLAERTAREVAKAKPQHVLIAPLSSCISNEQLCELRNSTLRSALQKAMPGVGFVNWQAAVRLLPRLGLLAVDAYEPNALNAVAGDAGADVLITEGAETDDHHYVLVDTVTDTHQRKQLARLTASSPMAPPGAPGVPVLYRDPNTGAYIITFAGDNSQPGSLVFAKCQSCPLPQVSTDLLQGNVEVTVRLRATINTQGRAEHIGVVQGQMRNPALTRATIQAVRGWTFQPATLNGKPLPMRIPLEVTFHTQ